MVSRIGQNRLARLIPGPISPFGSLLQRRAGKGFLAREEGKRNNSDTDRESVTRFCLRPREKEHHQLAFKNSDKASYGSESPMALLLRPPRHLSFRTMASLFLARSPLHSRAPASRSSVFFRPGSVLPPSLLFTLSRVFASRDFSSARQVKSRALGRSDPSRDAVRGL